MGLKIISSKEDSGCEIVFCSGRIVLMSRNVIGVGVGGWVLLVVLLVLVLVLVVTGVKQSQLLVQD